MFSGNRDASVAIRVITAKSLDLDVDKTNQVKYSTYTEISSSL